MKENKRFTVALPKPERYLISHYLTLQRHRHKPAEREKNHIIIHCSASSDTQKQLNDANKYWFFQTKRFFVYVWQEAYCTVCKAVEKCSLITHAGLKLQLRTAAHVQSPSCSSSSSRHFSFDMSQHLAGTEQVDFAVPNVDNNIPDWAKPGDVSLQVIYNNSLGAINPDRDPDTHTFSLSHFEGVCPHNDVLI